MFKALSSSLSLRLLCIFIFTAILLIGSFIVAFSHGMSGQWRRTIQPHLVQYVEYVQQDLGSPPNHDRADALSERLLVDIYIYQQGEFVYSTNSETLPLDTLVFVSANRRFPIAKQSTKNSLQLNAAITRNDSSEKKILRIEQNNYAVYYDLQSRQSNSLQHNRFANELIIALLGLAVVLIASYLAIRHQLRPIWQIQKSVGRMANAELDHRINRKGSSDLDVLAQSIDGMAERLQALLDAKRQLLMALSHELRSPVTRARITTELLPESKNRERLTEDLQNMERMIQDIMESERLQSNHAVLNKDSIQLENLLNDELKRIFPYVELHVSPSYQVSSIDADAPRLRIAFRNLLLNAQQHGTSDENDVKLNITLAQSNDSIEVVIRDYGKGIDSEHLRFITDPFYRPDSSRSRDTGGFGMGLTLARHIVEAHAGSMVIESKPHINPGTQITITLPVA